MTLRLNASPDAIARAYDAYVDRLHDEYYAEGPRCPECDAEMDVEGDKWAGTTSCPDCDYSHTWEADFEAMANDYD